jgi:hypothetical protein
MVKLVFLCRRRHDVSHERYARRLLEDHVPIALRHHPTLRTYVVNIVEAGPAGDLALDSIGELSFDTLADYRDHLYDSPEGERIVRADVARFMGGATAYVMREHATPLSTDRQHLGSRSLGHKVITFFRHTALITPATIVSHWERHRTPGALAGSGLFRYVMNVVVESLGTDAPGTGAGWCGSEELHIAATATAAHPVSGRLRTMAAALETPDRARATYRVAEYIQKLPRN